MPLLWESRRVRQPSILQNLQASIPDSEISQRAPIEQYIWSSQYDNVNHLKSDAASSETPISIECVVKAKWAVFATISATISHLLSSWLAFAGSASPAVLTHEEVLTLQFSSMDTPTASKKLSMSFEGNCTIILGLLRETDFCAATRILVIGVGQSAYLSYLEYHYIYRFKLSINIC